MQLGMVDPERLDLDDDMAGLGLRLRNVLVNQAVKPTEFLENDGAHDDSPLIGSTHPLDSRGWSLGLRNQARNSRIAAAISAACVSSAKCPVSRKRTTAAGMSRLKASAPAGRKNGSFLPHTAKSGGL